MEDKTFATPVMVSLGAMGLRFVASAWEALECLRNQWPQQEGVEYKRAVRICKDALEGWMTAAKARQAFVRAARRAGVLVDNPSAK
ncbi:DUF982 domain-containing protein [Phyllobacterium lublinensis]|jgi:hypothetical protein|uniref:DUF982 domain-containing protein n=1 Tax=Phyllobacterium lublinensis TaxID=2875708 RepID=UPI001CCDFF34|nr:DUF982 domain-containing protein [Phyllobacterium sp. 2063]MBZ9653442.1 DUF982 domain-containing protein [Phyllobacterium sp. 2063]